jgi:putative membrane protein
MKTKIFGVVVLGLVSVGSLRAQTDLDKLFLSKASEGNFAEIELSQLALIKTSNAKVKAFAEKMVADHTMLESKMKPFAEADGVMPANAMNADHQAEFDRLKKMQGPAFDVEYIKAMDMDHHKAEAAFDMELQRTDDPDFKKAVTSGKKVVAEHTMMADKLAGKMGISVSDM